MLRAACIALLFGLGCGSAEPQAGLFPLEAQSRDGRFQVRLWPETQPIPIGEFHTWRIEVRDPEGALIAPYEVTLEGGMPQHGHGLPTRPEARRVPGEDAILVEGVQFNMPGDWTLHVAVVAAAGGDLATFVVPVGP